jgi:phosphoglycolate phosphatase
MAVEAILFDKDGTLFDFEASWADWMHGTIADLSQGNPPVATALAGSLRFDIAARRFAPDSPVIAGTLDEVAPLLVPHLPALRLDDIIARLEASASAIAMVPAVPLHPLLEELRADGYALGVATNASGGEARAHLDAAGIATFFDFVAGCDAGFGAKPAPGMCLAFARALGLPPEAVLMVGDSLHDLRAGRAAGMRTAGVLTGLATQEDLAPHADVVLADIGHLQAWLQDAGGAPSRPRAG